MGNENSGREQEDSENVELQGELGLTRGPMWDFRDFVGREDVDLGESMELLSSMRGNG